MKQRLILLLISVSLLSACNDLDALLHIGHHHDHEDHSHDEDQDHHDDHGHGDDHHADDEDNHHDAPTWVITHLTDKTELFVEFQPLVTEQASAFAVHLTTLENFQPVASGQLTVILSGGGVPDETFVVKQPETAGIFRPEVKPKYKATRDLTIRLQTASLETEHHLGSITVFDLQEDAIDDIPVQAEFDQPISLPKQTQWQVDFALAKATAGKLNASILAMGTVEAPANQQTHLTATSAGHLINTSIKPYIGMQVSQDQLLANLAPKVANGTDLITLRAARDKARSDYQQAQYDLQRIEQLWQNKAIAERRLQEAKNKQAIAKTELTAAETRLNQASGEHDLNTGVPIYAPIDGVIVEVGAVAGQHVHEGQLLFQIINKDKLWLTARVAETDIGKVQHANAAWFSVEGMKHSFDTEALNGRVIARSGVVDPISRTMPFIIEIDNPNNQLAAGMFANIRLFTGDTEHGVIVPRSAVFDDDGQSVVYVQLDGERFQRRIVRLGIQQGDNIVIKSGVNAGEYVVSRGAYQLRLASTSPAAAGHGHAH